MKKVTRILTFALVLTILLTASTGLISCTGGSKVDIAFCMSQSNELNEAILTYLEEAFPDLTVRAENANSNSTTQTEQVNNFITMGVKMLVVAPVSLEALEKISQSPSTKIIIPSEIQSLAGLVTSASELAEKTKSSKE